MKVDHVRATSQASELLAKPRAPHRVKPMAPMRFQKPRCHPRVVSEGVYQFGWVSTMKRKEETMKPRPPTTWIRCVSIESPGVQSSWSETAPPHASLHVY